MRYNSALKHKRNLKFSKMSNSELKQTYAFLRSNNNNYYNKKEFNQLITYLMTNNKGDIVCQKL